jgi:processive 1,2-diacylglycerol beta-glucosyltransferase
MFSIVLYTKDMDKRTGCNVAMYKGLEYRKRKQSILILSGNLGDGHRQAAEALSEAFVRYGPDTDVHVVDFMEWIAPYLHTLVKYCFVKGVEKVPSVYGYLYDKTRRAESVSLPFRSLLWLGLSRLSERLEELQPDEVVCTFPLAAAAVSLLKEKGLCGLPLITVITDHTDHGLWIHPHTDRYLVGSEQVKASLLALGIAPGRIAVTGIPLRQRFCTKPDRQLLRQRYGLRPEAPTVLVMGGGCGLLGDSAQELLELARRREALQLVVVCGRNEAMRQQLEQEVRERGLQQRVHVLGFVADIQDWMAVADVLITKPGGLTTAEALAMELPMLLLRPIPGQEEDNARFLEHTGAAVRCLAGQGVAPRLLELLEEPERLRRMRSCAGAYRREQSARAAVEEILATYAGKAQGMTTRIPVFG